MSLGNFYVIEELFQLSKLSDEIINMACSDAAINDNFFEETKKGIYEILNSKDCVKKFSGSVRKSNNSRFKLDYSLEPFLETRSHVHQKSSPKVPDENSCSVTPLKLNETPGGSNAVEILHTYHSNSRNCIDNSKINSAKLALQRKVCNEIRQSPKLEYKRCSEANSENNYTPSNSRNCRSILYKTPASIEAGKSHELSLSSGQSRLKSLQPEETIIISSSEDDKSFYNSQNVYYNKFKTESNLKDKDKSVIILDKTYTLSSDSSAENNCCCTSLSNTSVLSRASPIFSLNTKEKYGENKKLKRRKVNKDSGRGNSPISFIENRMKNTTDENDHGITQTGFDTHRTRSDLNSHEDLVRSKEQNISFQIQDKSFCSPIVSSPVYKSRKRYRLRSREIKSDKLERTTKKLQVPTDYSILQKQLMINLQHNKNIRTNIDEAKLSQSTITTQYSHLTDIQENGNYRSTRSKGRKRLPVKHSSGNLNSDSDKCRKESRIQESKRVEKENIPIKGCGNGIFKRKSSMNKKYPEEFRTSPVQFNRKNTTNRNLRSNTPMEFVSYNRESLKVKAEEKRRKREIRVQKTKEKRERLEREREERIRLSEQRLKQRFQLHEETLKQKTEKFKIKSRNQRRCYTKRSVASTSSKDSKEDRTKDNDDFCRNAVNSGQKLSKESNSYHDVSREKADLASLEGNVGLHPEISKKRNAILVGCEKTPVEFLVSCDGTPLKKFEKISAIQKSKRERSKDLKASDSEQDDTKSPFLKCLKTPSEQDDTKSPFSKCLKTSSEQDDTKSPFLKCSKTPCSEKASTSSKENKYIKSSKKDPKQKFLDSDKMKSKTPCFKKTNSYLLRSAVKRNKNLNGVSALLLNEVNSKKHKTSGHGYTNPECCESITSSSEGDKAACSKFCFKMSTNNPKKNVKVPNYIRSNTSNCSRDSSAKQTRSKRCRLFDLSKNIDKGKSKNRVVNEMQELTSYEIPDIIDDNFDETKVDVKKIPLWATGVYIKHAIIQQFYNPPKVEEIFGVVMNESIDLAEFFDREKPEYHRRTSSDNWSLNVTPV